ncbi:MAG TPA: 3-hydroxyacyl-CoA dehydrogenase NAD-binding domain-containing protein [Candidatus Limnocylindrales bacterium]|nr:3-hydroxyacyl-CoA dehydrogenase NAD-binding domain-containing protein [Candidatus Limnocylindrales bacterium]
MEIKTIGVIGAGTMGRGIAYAASAGAYRTILEDVSEPVLDQGVAYIRQAFDDGVARAKVTPEQRDKALAAFTTARSVEDVCREADLLIEAVPEEMELKLEIFTIFDKFAKPGAILASNTSSLSITEMAAITFRAENCIGMHFFNPVPKMKLLELVRSLETSNQTVETCIEVGRRMGKEVVVVRESPGFITSRINAMIGNEAFYMLQEGVATAADIDKALKLGLNHPMGPFELVDLVGLDVRLSILEYLHKTLGEKYRPCPLLAQYVKAGRLGRKCGRGVYEYESTGEKKASA